MIEVRCPRCTQSWYSKKEVRGRRRLCPDCAAKRPRKATRAGVSISFFAVATAVLFCVDAALIGLAAAWPDPFARVLPIYGGVVLFPCACWFGAVATMAQRGVDVDWGAQRWTLVGGLAGLACIVAYFVMRRPTP